MKNKCIGHIKEKIRCENSGEVSDISIEKIMLATFSFLNKTSNKCFYCQNFNKWSLFSLCKVHPHIQPNCFNHAINVDKMIKNNYGKIISESSMDGCDELSPEVNRNIVAESIRLYEHIAHDGNAEI